VVLRQLKLDNPTVTLAHRAYYQFAERCISETLEGPLKGMRHACEAETSLMMYLHPNLVREEALRDDGLEPVPAISGLIHHFDEITEQGSYGFATLATAEKGEKIFAAACSGLVQDLTDLANGYVLRGS
jgi:creatinine amidohydrolase